MCDVKSKDATPLIDGYLLEEHCCQISSRSDLKRRSLGLFEEVAPVKNNSKNKISSDIRSVPYLKMMVYFVLNYAKLNISLSWH